MSRTVSGTLYGLTAVAFWAGYITFASVGVNDGLTPSDFVILRFVTAALVMAPWLMLHEPRTLGGVGWGRGMVLACTVGPLFIWTGVGGYVFAPLSHGAVVQPATATLTALALATLWLGEPLGRARVVGTVAVLVGIALVVFGGGSVPAGPDAWIGDLLFMSAGALFAAFTLLVRRWELSALAATAAVSTISALVMLPALPFLGTWERLTALPASVVVTQVLVQGVGSGVLSVATFARAVAYLGAGRAALFPAALPAAALLMGIPVAGEWPGTLEWTGAALATLGLLLAVAGPLQRERRVAAERS